MDENDTVEGRVWAQLETENAKRDELLTQTLYPWRVEHLREVQAEWNRRTGWLDRLAGVKSPTKPWALNEIVSVLIGQEHDKLFLKAHES